MHTAAHTRGQRGGRVNQIAGNDRPTSAGRINSPGQASRQRIGETHAASITGADVAQGDVKADLITSRDWTSRVGSFLDLDVRTVNGHSSCGRVVCIRACRLISGGSRSSVRNTAAVG